MWISSNVCHRTVAGQRHSRQKPEAGLRVNANGRKWGLRASMRFLWRVNRGRRPGDNRAMQGGGAEWILAFSWRIVYVFSCEAKRHPHSGQGEFQSLSGYCTQNTADHPAVPQMLERPEKTDALLLTNGIYLRAGSQYVIVNILLLTELASPSDDQKLTCLLSYFDNMMNYTVHNSLNTN